MKVKNKTLQVIPIVLPQGDEIRLLPKQTVVLALDKPTNQLLSLSTKGKISIEK